MYFNDIILDRMVDGNSLFYRIKGSTRRQQHSLSFRVGLSYEAYASLQKDLPKPTIQRNGDYTYDIKQGHALYHRLDQIFSKKNLGDSYCDKKTNKVVHISEEELT